MSQHTKTAYLYLTHFLDEYVREEFEKLESSMRAHEDAILLYHQLPGAPQPLGFSSSFIITNDDIERLGFAMMQKAIVPGHLAFLTLLFARANPEYDNYWTVEQDVRFTGEWQTFFSDVNRSEADLLTAHLRGYKDEPDWRWWHTFRDPAQPIARENRIRSFNPIYRLSSRALQSLDMALQRGCEGHSEVLVPTVLVHSGHLVKDFTLLGNLAGIFGTKRHYTSITLKSGTLRYGGTFRTRPVRCRAGWRRSMLYHPVKEQRDCRNYFVEVISEIIGQSILNSWSLIWSVRQWFQRTGFRISKRQRK